MHAVILWIGLISAWFLFAGSIYQAALELQDEDIEIDRIREAGRKVSLPKKVSVWWWLIPPIKIYLEYKKRRAYQHQYIKALTQEDLEAMISFRNKASAWQMVALGGLLFAIKETYELTEYLEWDHAVFFAIIILLGFISIAHLITRLLRNKKLVELNKGKSD
jgi:hypothetical protein